MDGNSFVLSKDDPNTVNLLFLALKFLQQYDEVSDSVAGLELALRASGAFGNVVSWDGTERKRGIEEVQRMFPDVPKDQLARIVGSSCVGPVQQSRVSVQICRPSNLHLTGEQKVVAVDLMRRWADMLGRMRSLRLEYFRYRCRLGDVKVLGSDPTVDLTTDESGLVVSSLQSTLREIGRERVTGELEGNIIDISQQYQHLSGEPSAAIQRQLRSLAFINTADACRVQLNTSLTRLDTRRIGLAFPISSAHRREIRSKLSGGSTSPFANFRLQWTVCGHMGNPAYCSVFDQTGNFLLTGADDYLIKIWDVKKGLLVRSCKGHLSYISLIAVSPDNSLFASCCTFGTIRVWRMSDGVCLKMMKHNGGVNWIKFDASSCALASASDDGQCIVWDLSVLLATDELESPLLRKALSTRESTTTKACSESVDDDDAEEVIKGGLFDWSTVRRGISTMPLPNTGPPSVAANAAITQQITGILPLPHVSDEFGGGLVSSSSIRVVCLDICTVAGVVVTGSDDAVARIWRFDQPPIGNHRYPYRGPQKRHDLHRGNYTQEELHIVQRHLLLRLEGHIHPVTDVQFNSMGDRVVTGSNLDGTVRIWSMDRNYTASVHLILDLSEQDDVTGGQAAAAGAAAQATLTRSGRRGGPRTNNTSLTPKVHNVAWTCDDARIITVQSITGSKNIFEAGKATRLKVWDAMTGDLLRIIWSISEVTSGCLVRHPFNPCFAVTAGEDGFVNVWNIEGEELVAKVALKDDDDRPAEIIDVSISNDATRIAATDKKGRVSFISLDNPEKFKHFPYGSQYFSTDYTDIFHDAEGFAFDVGTQLPLHLSPIGLLCRSDGSAYEIQPPKLFGPPTLSVALVQQSLEKINDDRLSLWKEMDRVYEIFNHNKRTNRLRIKYRSAREDANHADSKLKAAVKSKPTSNVIFRSIDELSDTSTDSAKDSDYQSGGHHSNDENTDDMDGSSSDSYAGLQLRRSSRAHRPTNYSDAYDEEEVDRALLSPRSSRRRSTARRLRRGGYGRMGSSEDDDDDDDDDGDNDVFNDEDREGRSSRRHRRGGRRRIVVDDDDVAAHDHFAEGDEYVGDEDDDGGAERSPRRRVHRAVTSSSSTGNGRGRRPDTAHSSRSRNSRGSSARDGSGSGSGGARGGGRQSRHGGRAQPHAQTQRSAHRTEKWIADESGVGCLRIPLGNEAHRAWLQCDLQYDMLYVPQLGDEVVYVPQGHAKYLESFPEEGVPACNRFRGSPFVECTVVDIRYVFPNQHHYNLSRSVVALVTLAVTGTPTRVDIRHSKYIATVVEPRATRRQEQQLFVVSLRSSSCADYVIPKVVFHRALTVAWHPNLRITSHFCDTDEQGRISFKEYAGVVLNLEAVAPEWPLSPWMNLLVQWDADDDGGGGGGGGAEETSLMSFWEVQPDWPAAIARDSLYMKMKLPSLAPTDCARIADDISQLMETHPVEYSAFEYEPDPELYPDYSVSVPLPMTLNLVVQRLRNGYYRQMVALEHDIQLIVNNCRVFNVDDAPITVHALQLQEEVSLIIRSHCAPPHTASSASMTAAAAAGDGGDVEDSVVVGDRGTRKRGRERSVSEGDHEVSKRTRATAEPASASLRLSLGRRRVQHDDNEEEEDEGDAGDDNEDEGGGDDDEEGDDDDEADDDDDDDDAVAPGGRKLSLNLRRHGGATTASAPLPPVKKDQGSMRLVLGRGATTAANRSKTRADSDEDSDEASAAEEESDDDSDDDSSEDSALNRRTTRRQQSTRSSRFKLRSSKPAAPPAPSSRIRGRGRLSVSDDDDEDDDDDDDESADVKGPRRQTRSVAPVSTGRASRSTRQSAASTAAAVGARSQRGRRSSRSHADDEDDDDDVWKDDDDDDDDDAEDQDDDDSEPRGRTTRRSSIRGAVQKPSQSRTSTQASSSSKPSKRSAIVPSSDEEEEEEDTRPTRRSQRGNTASKRRYGDEDSDEEEEEDADEGHTEIASTRRRPSRATTTTTTTTTAAAATNEPAPRSTRSLRRQTMDVDEEASATRAAATPQRRAVTAFNSRARQHISPPPPPTNSLAASTRHRNSDSIFANADVNEGRRRLTADMKRQINDVLDIAAGFDTEAIFQEPVDTDEIEGYLDIVAEPMDFTTIRGKLKRLAYSSVQDVILDILLIYDNCVLFNGDDDYYGRYAIRQKKQFVAYLRKQHIDLP